MAQYKVFSKPAAFLFGEMALNAWKFGGFISAVRLVVSGVKARFTAPERGTLSVMGFKFSYAHKESLMHMLFEQFGNNEYFFIPKSQNPVIIDAGANIGDSLLYFAYRYPSARVYCFEPNPEAFALLEKNILDNKLEKARAYKLGLGDASEVQTHHIAGGDTYLGASGSDELVASFGADVSSAGYQVQIRRLDEISEVVEEQRIDLLKIDVEGAEEAVMRGAGSLLAKTDRVILEFHTKGGAKNSYKNIRDLLESFGFAVSVSGTWRNLENYTNDMVFFMNGMKS